MNNHDICIEKGFHSSVEFKELLDYEQGDGGKVEILFEETCQECGQKIGEEIQIFEYVGKREAIR